VNADEHALDAWTEFAGADRMCASIIGPSRVALDLWAKLSERWGGAWSQVRDVRPHQPVMSISTPPAREAIGVNDVETMSPPDRGRPRGRRIPLFSVVSYFRIY